jgi:hypothetical protein
MWPPDLAFPLSPCQPVGLQDKMRIISERADSIQTYLTFAIATLCRSRLKRLTWAWIRDIAKARLVGCLAYSPFQRNFRGMVVVVGWRGRSAVWMSAGLSVCGGGGLISSGQRQAAVGVR